MKVLRANSCDRLTRMMRWWISLWALLTVSGCSSTPELRKLGVSAYNPFPQLNALSQDEIISRKDREYVIFMTGLSVSPDGRFVVGVSDRTSLFLWDVVGHRLVREFISSPFSFSQKSDLIALADNYESISVRRTVDMSPILKTSGHAAVMALSLSPDSKLLIVAERNDSMIGRAKFRCIDIESGRTLWKFDRNDGIVTRITWSGDGQNVLIALKMVGTVLIRNDGLLELVSASSGREIQRKSVHSYVTCFCRGPDSNTVVAGNAAGEVTAWDLHSLTTRAAVNPDIGSITNTEITNISAMSGGYYLISSNKRTVIVDDRLENTYPAASAVISNLGFCSIDDAGDVMSAVRDENRIVVFSTAK